jgi:hypothetical protein
MHAWELHMHAWELHMHAWELHMVRQQQRTFMAASCSSSLLICSPRSAASPASNAVRMGAPQ